LIGIAARRSLGREALQKAGVPEATARDAARAVEEAGRVNTKLTVLTWIGGILAGGTIAGFALVTTQLIRLTGEVSALAEIVRGMQGS
jgi:hypothetical protein